jgi:LPS sulfotransferase NodH
MMSLRSLSLEGGFSLWEEYLHEASGHVARLGERAMDVCYEQLLQDPAAALTEVCRFCGVEPQPEQLAATVKGVRSERANAFAADPVLSEFAAANQQRLASFGY